MNSTAWNGIVSAGCGVVLAGVAFGWQRTVGQRHETPRVVEAWEHIRQQFSMPEPLQETSEVSETLLQAVVRANPFSMERRAVAQITGSTTEGSASASQPLPPQFVYKGRVLVGAKERAVIEEAKSKKTYFLQVGQSVEGMTVLEIAESHVVLSEPDTNNTLIVTLTPKTSPARPPARPESHEAGGPARPKSPEPGGPSR